MPRIRSVKPDFFRDKDLIRLPAITRICFEALWCAADRDGRLEDDPEQLCIDWFPCQRVNMAGMLDQLTGKFIVRYESDGKKYIWIRNFTKHQRPHHTEPPSTIPPPTTVVEPLSTGCPPLGREGKGNSKGNTHTGEPSSPSGVGFDEFWSAYPRKRSKDYAAKCFAQALAKGVTLATILAALAAQKSSPDWTRDGGRYIPHPSTWLNQGRWSDVVEPTNGHGTTQHPPDPKLTWRNPEYYQAARKQGRVPLTERIPEWEPMPPGPLFGAASAPAK